jgi:S-(hydroxymethyl)glutathione dehydrogenase/alcohol dehydrogenase
MKKGSFSRRDMLKQGAAIGGASLIAGAPALSAQAPQAPAVLTGAQAGRRFRALVGNAATGTVEELRLTTIGDKHVVVRTEASAPCYTMVSNGIGGTPTNPRPSTPPGAPAAAPGAAPPRPGIANHTFVGIVEAVGSSVKRVQPGDRVVVGVTSYCGVCYQCLRGRADHCQFTFAIPTFPPFAARADGTPVGAQLGIGGLSELNVVLEEYTCPVFTDVSPVQLSLLGDTAATGVAAAMCLMQVEPGSDVVVLGAGALGMSAIQAARIMGAAQVIAIEPVRHRRDLALTLGATTVLDPNAEGEGLVEKIREQCKGPTDRLYAGGRGWGTGARQFDNRGADRDR